MGPGASAPKPLGPFAFVELPKIPRASSSPRASTPLRDVSSAERAEPQNPFSEELAQVSTSAVASTEHPKDTSAAAAQKIGAFRAALVRELHSYLGEQQADIAAAVARLESASPREWRELRKGVELDQALARGQHEAKWGGFPQRASHRAITGDRSGPARPASEEEREAQMSAIAEARADLRSAYPELGLLDDVRDLAAPSGALLAHAKGRAREIEATLLRLSERVDQASIDLEQYPGLVERTLQAEGLGDSSSEESDLVRSWVEHRELTGTVMHAGLAVAAIGTGLAGAGWVALALGASEGALQLEEAAELMLGAEATLTGGDRLVDPDAAKQALASAILALAFSGMEAAITASNVGARLVVGRTAKSAPSGLASALKEANPAEVAQLIRAFESGEPEAMAKIAARLDPKVAQAITAELGSKEALRGALGASPKAFARRYAQHRELLLAVGPKRLAALTERMGANEALRALESIPKSTKLLDAVGAERFARIVGAHGVKTVSAGLEAFGEAKALAMVRGAKEPFFEMFERTPEILGKLAKAKDIEGSAAKLAQIARTDGIDRLRQIDRAARRGVVRMLEAGVEPKTLSRILRVEDLGGTPERQAAYVKEMIARLSKMPKEKMAAEAEHAVRMVERDLGDAGHSVTRHGPQVSRQAHQSRVQGGLPADGLWSPPTSKSSGFRSYEAQSVSLERADASFKQRFGQSIDEPPRHPDLRSEMQKAEANPTQYDAKGRIVVKLEDKFIGEHSDLMPSYTVTRQGDSSEAITRTRTTYEIAFFPGEYSQAQIRVSQHLPEARHYDFNTQRYTNDSEVVKW